MDGNNIDDEKAGQALTAAWQIIRSDDLREQLQESDEHFNKFLRQFHLPQSTKPHLLQIIERVEYLQSRTSSSHVEAQAVSSSSGDDKDVEKMLLESFIHIRWSFWISMIMSVILFVVGLVFLIISVTRALGEDIVSTATLTIAGLGLADFVLLFYTRPWQDISVNLSNSQQVKIIATSYLSGLSLLQQGKTDAIKSLERLTKSSVGLLEDFTEERSSSSTNDSKVDKS